MQLTPEDFDALARCYITRELIGELPPAARPYRVDSLEGRERVGHKGAGDYSGVIYPVYDPETHQVVGERLRRDYPPFDARTGKEDGKYLTAPGSRSHFYMPFALPGWFTDVTMPVLFGEGEKKGLAAHRAAVEEFAHGGRPAWFVITIPGVWNWKGKIGIVSDANGRRRDEKGVIPDFDRIVWRGRKVYISFDSNTATNPSVRAARRELARELESRGAQVYFVDLPAAAGVNGMDDYLAQEGSESFYNLVQTATRHDWHDELAKSERGKILPSFGNALTALRLAPQWCGVLGFNKFADRTENRKPTPWGAEPGAWDDQNDRLTIEWLEHQGIRLGRVQVSDAVETVAKEHPFHPVREYLDGLHWDGVSRLDEWLTRYLSAEPTHYTRAVGARWMMAAVARVYQPAIKADHALILESKQGIGKSTAFEILGDEFYSDDIADLGTKDASLGTAGVWIVELAELSAMSRSEVEKIKSFISRERDRFRAPYDKRLKRVDRQCVFGGTVNLKHYLKDETGGRRFWPVACGSYLNLESLRRDRDQLWAEAVVRYQDGEPWWLDTAELVEAASEEQEERREKHPWEDLIAKWLATQTEVTTADVLMHAIAKDRAQWTRGDESQIGTILQRLNWEVAARPRVNGRPGKRIYREKVEVKS